MTQRFKYVGIETTTVCNAKCTVCPREDHYGHRFGYMDQGLFEKIILDLRDNHEIDSLIRFGGMGDASCDRFLLDRLRFIKNEAPELKVGLSSNMEVWRPAFTEAIVAEQLISHMRFSILAHSEKFSEIVYKDPKLAEKARAKIDSFIKANDEAGHPIWIEAYTLMLDGMERDVELIKEGYWDAADEFEVWKPHAWSNLFHDLRAKQEDRCPCKSVTSMDQILIGIYGDVIPCSMDINYTLSLGSLQHQTLEEILTGEKCLSLQDMNATGRIEENPACNGCVYLNAHPTEVMLESKSHGLRIDRQEATA
jgi:radical SAM protein with 4Fe4S-binding SPASM domain